MSKAWTFGFHSAQLLRSQNISRYWAKESELPEAVCKGPWRCDHYVAAGRAFDLKVTVRKPLSRMVNKKPRARRRACSDTVNILF